MNNYTELLTLQFKSFLIHQQTTIILINMKKIINLILISILILFSYSCKNESSNNKSEVRNKIVNVYTHRHYQTDDVLFRKFTEKTGIKVNVVNANADELIQRLENEGVNSPADVLITVDAGRLNRAQEKGLFQPIQSDVLNANIPAHFREKDGHWFGITYRARVIVYAKDRINPDDIQTYDDLTHPRWRKKVLIRSSENVYNQSLLASIIYNQGEEKATTWAEGVVANFARSPKGSDRDQVKAIASGEGDIAISNSYYIGLMLHDESEEVRKAGESVGIIFPNQNTTGTHVNISGIGIAKHAPNKDNALQLIHFLSDIEAQNILTEMNYEYPVNPKAQKAGLLASWGDFKKDTLNLSELGKLNSSAVKIFDKINWK